MQINARIGAILGSDPETKTLEFLGYGYYAGEEVPIMDETVNNSMAPLLAAEKIKNPKLVLDNGDVVWGCECWWGPEEKVRPQLEKYKAAGYAIKDVRIADFRTVTT